jgi:hypothetical protein
VGVFRRFMSKRSQVTAVLQCYQAFVEKAFSRFYGGWRCCCVDLYTFQRSGQLIADENVKFVQVILGKLHGMASGIYDRGRLKLTLSAVGNNILDTCLVVGVFIKSQTKNTQNGIIAGF